MALIKCPECGEMVSDQAPACIHCGYPLNAQAQQQQQVRPEDQVKCPKCGSTNITTTLQGWNIKTGMLGSGQTVNRCASCGYKWKPKKHR